MRTFPPLGGATPWSPRPTESAELADRVEQVQRGALTVVLVCAAVVELHGGGGGYRHRESDTGVCRNILTDSDDAIYEVIVGDRAAEAGRSLAGDVVLCDGHSRDVLGLAARQLGVVDRARDGLRRVSRVHRGEQVRRLREGHIVDACRRARGASPGTRRGPV